MSGQLQGVGGSSSWNANTAAAVEGGGCAGLTEEYLMGWWDGGVHTFSTGVGVGKIHIMQ